VTLYVDSSAFLKLYLAESDSAECARLMREDPAWMSARHTWVEVRRILARELGGRSLTDARHQFTADWARTAPIEIDQRTCEFAAEIAESMGTRTLDALHLGAAERVRAAGLAFLTYDLRQARAARALDWSVLGA
jgi:predicted nucleic acid-binding protein